MNCALVKAKVCYGAEISCYITFTQNTLVFSPQTVTVFLLKKQVKSMERALVKAEMRCGAEISCFLSV